MGYATTTPYTLMELNTNIETPVELSTVVANHEINDIGIPQYHGTPDYAYLDVIIQGVQNTNAASNFIHAGSYTGFEDSGGTFRAGANIPNSAIEIPGTTTVYSTFIIPGYINLAQYMEAGATRGTSIYGHVEGNNLYFFNVYARLRLYFAVR